MSVITQDIRNNIPSNKRNRSNSATGQNIRGSNSSANDNWKLRKSVAENVGSNSPYPPSADTSFSTQSTLGHPKRKETRTSTNRTVKKTGLHANTPPKDNKKIVVKNKPVKIKKSKYAHNLKQVGMPQDGGFSNQDYVIKGISTNLSQGNPNNPAGEYKDKNRGLNDRIVKPKVIKNKTVKPKPKINISKNFPRIGPDLAHDVESNKKKPEVIESITVRPKPDIGRQVPDLSTPDYDPADKPVVDYSKNNKDPELLMKGARRKKVGKGSYKRGTPTKTKMVLAPHRNPTNKKVRVADRPSKRKRPKNTSGSARFSGGGLVASLYESF